MGTSWRSSHAPTAPGKEAKDPHLQRVTPITGSGIDIWHGAGPSANSGKRSRSLHASGRAANRDRRPSTPDRRLWIVEFDFRTSGSTSRVDRPSATDVPICAVARMATVVVLARDSVHGRRREIADSAHADIRRRYQSL
jgi:hypothetical protein